MGINIYLKLSMILQSFLFSENLTTFDYINYLKLSCITNISRDRSIGNLQNVNFESIHYQYIPNK